MKGRSGRKGFTLVELLVVTAIIALLASLLIPTLARAKTKTQAAICLSNLKQLNLAWALYTEDNQGRLPSNWRDGVSRSEDPPLNWVRGRMYYESDPRPADHIESTNLTLLTAPLPGTIGPYLRAPGIFRCPSDKSQIVLDGSARQRVRSFSMNHFIGNDVNDFSLIDHGGGIAYRTAESITDPANRWVFIDEHEDSIEGGEFKFVSIRWKQHIWDDFPASRHTGSGTLSFADGHAESRRWVDPRTRIPVLRRRQYGIQSNNNRDVLWLWLRTTTPAPGFGP